MIIQIIFWVLIIYGITQIIVESKLFKPLREWYNPGNPKNHYSNRLEYYRDLYLHTMMTCMLCMSVWVATFVSMHFFSPTLLIYGTSVIFYDAMIGSTLVWFLNVFERKVVG